jgi:hypothetical protein
MKLVLAAISLFPLGILVSSLPSPYVVIPLVLALAVSLYVGSEIGGLQNKADHDNHDRL